MNPLTTRWLVGAALALATFATMAADTFPIKPIRVIVYVGPGTLADVTTRLVAEKLSEQLKQPVVVENMAGASACSGSAT